jgi:hypothetical protein
LWIPVILSAVGVFVVSSIVHMALKYHRSDIKQLPNEEGVREALAKANPSPGLYFYPYCADHAQMKDPKVKEKFDKGPVAMITIVPNGLPVLSKHLTQWFAFTLLVSFVAAYVARHTLQPGASGIEAMRITGTVAFAGYGSSPLMDSIWKGQPWGNTGRQVLDGIIYALVTGLVFRLMWPGA